jgi:hypothetical protein
LYSHLRFVIAAALIAFGGVIAIGVPALLLAVDRPLLAQTDVSEPAASSMRARPYRENRDALNTVAISTGSRPAERT